MKKILITGIAGFIGFHLAKKLVEKKYMIIGIDNLNNYYDKKLKKNRVKILGKKIIFHKIDITNFESANKIFKKYRPDIVINLAAQPGVRYSLKNPKAYISSNIVGFFNIIELSKIYKIKQFLYASSSSVYGLEKVLPFSENMKANSPASLYGATKKSNELIAHSYSYLHNLSTIGLRYFTVFGPWGRPDMAIFKFVKNIIKNKKIVVYNNGNMTRDFTYIDDAVNITYKLITYKKKRNIKTTKNLVPSKVVNIANSKPTNIKKFISILEKNLNKKSNIVFKNNIKTEIKNTKGDTKQLHKITNIEKFTSLEEGIKKFIQWYKNYYLLK